jgi:orotidine-5'-phosphate decarboxylase
MPEVDGGRDPIIVALDLDDRDRLIYLAHTLRGQVETVKIGLEAYAGMGPSIVTELSGMGFRVFADLKLHDIPNTVRGAVRALVQMGVSMLTVHACGGRGMLEASVAAAGNEAEALDVPVPLILGVTVLTSLDDAAVAEVGWRRNAEETALDLADLAMSCGLDGVVASAREAAALRSSLPHEAVIVTPGIRLAGEGTQDQARTATPSEALSAGSDYLVVGRPITAHADPVLALQEMRRATGL